MSSDSKGLVSGLPPVKTSSDSIEEENLNSNFEKSRNCPQCGKPGRIVSNYLGVNGHCGPCKIHWPVANSPLRPEIPSSLPRGLHKETYVEPDWTSAINGDDK